MKNMDNPVVQMAMDGVSIVAYDASGNVRIIRPSKWTSYQNSGYTPVGIGLQSGDKKLVISLTEATLNWSSEAVTGGGVVTTNQQTAMADWAGKSNTAAQAAKSQCSGTGYAPGYCAAFSCLNSNNKGIGAGQWWLPSLAELLLIYTNMDKINYALSLVGGTQLAEANYWSSTEYSATNAWNVNFNAGVVSSHTKASLSFRARPVAAFQ